MFSSKMYKERRVGQRDAQIAFAEKFKDRPPSEWSDSELKQVAHIIKWASVGFNTRESVKLSKSLLVRELGQRGYIKHIHSVYPVKQGHNLGEGQVTVYDYRKLLRTLVGWIRTQGSTAVDEFKILMKAVLEDIEKTFKKKMGWFWKMAVHWFGKFTDLFKLIREEKAAVTTIQESYKYLYPREREAETEGDETCPLSQPREESSDASSRLSTVDRPVELPQDLLSRLLGHQQL